MSAKVIDLNEYRRRKQSENAGKRLRGLGFPDDFSPFTPEPDIEFERSIIDLENDLDIDLDS